MPLTIRKATAQDAPAWLQLLHYQVGSDYPDPQVYEPAWAINQLEENETWFAELNGRLQATISFLNPGAGNPNPVANIGRHVNHPESYPSGAAAALMEHAVKLANERKQVIISRVIASDNHQQILYENGGFTCVGFQPFKHTFGLRESVLFYYRLGSHQIGNRFPISESVAQVIQLASPILKNLSIGVSTTVRDNMSGYPLVAEFEFAQGTRDDYELWKIQAQTNNPAVEISGAYNQGVGYLRTENLQAAPFASFVMRDGRVVAGILQVHDPLDRCVRLVDSFSQDEVSLGPLLNQVVKNAEEQLSALYVELDVLATATRLLKTCEQIGFLPIAYMPAIYSKAGAYADVVKLVKLNLAYSLEHIFLTTHSKMVVDIIDQAFQDQRMGVAVINLLRGLPFFQGLGDGELRKIARLFNQKLYRANEKIFNKGDLGNEAYVVMRGQINILLEPNTEPIAQLGSGEIFGELAFLDNSPRTAMAIATQPSILLVMQRGAFNALTQREPNLGLVVMRNIALELSQRLRKTNLALSQSR